MDKELNISQLFFAFNERYSRDARGVSPLHIFTAFSKISPENLSIKASERGMDAQIKTLDENLYQILVTLQRRSAKGYLVTYDEFWIFFFEPTESSTITGEVASTWIENFYPLLSMPFVESEQLIGLLEELNDLGNKNKQENVRIIDYVLIREGEKGTTKTWQKKTFSKKELLNTQKANDKRLEAIRFEFRVENTYFKAKISRNCHFIYYTGGSTGFSDLHRLVITSLIQIAQEEQKLFSGKERKVIGDEVIINPLAFVLDKPLSNLDLKELQVHLRRNFSGAVIHSSNPVLFISLIDRGDGSSFDVNVFENEIRVIPFNKATPESFTRLYKLISNLFPSAVAK